MQVHQVMTSEFQACLEDANLDRAAAILWEHDYGAVPVLDPEGRLVGILSERAVLGAAAIQPLPLSELPIEKFLVRDVEACHAQDDLLSALRLLAKQGVRRLPVIDDEGFVTGVVGVGDILAQTQPRGSLTDRDVVRVLQDPISGQKLPAGSVLCGWEQS